MPDRRKLKGDGFLDRIVSKHDTFQIARVTDIILNPDHPKFNTFGGFTSIGTIFYEISGLQGSNTGNTALPFHSNLSSYPLVNELVLLVEGPNNGMGGSTSSKSYYYLNMFSIWNHPHHNAYPNPIKRNFSQGDNSTLLNSPKNISQDTFIENSNIHPLLPLPGDIIQEGRWGNSIRFSSTANPNSTTKRAKKLTVWNTWSKTGNNGDPITLIRNGQRPNSPKEGYVPITEDVNDDLSSIYLTSYQQFEKFKIH